MVENKQEFNIKELSIKLQVLTNALKEERKKSQNYSTKLQEYEELLIKKDTEIININKVKFEIQSNLSALLKKPIKNTTDIKLNQVVNTFFNKEKINFDQFDRIKDENNSLKLEYKEYQKKYVFEHENREQQKIKFDTMLALQDKQIKEAQDTIVRLENQKVEQINTNQSILNLVQQIDEQKELFDLKYKRIEDEINSKDQRSISLMIDIGKAQSELKPKKEKIKDLQKRLKEQTATLNEMKNQITHKVLDTQDFMVIKEESFLKKDKCKVTFTKSPVDKKYKILIGYDNKDKPQDIIDFLDVTEYKINVKKFDITYVDVRIFI